MSELQNNISKIIYDKNPTLSPMSIKTYTNCILKILEFMKSDNLNDLINYDKVLKVIFENWENPSTIKTKLSSVIVILKCGDIKDKNLNNALSKYSEIIEEQSNKINKKLSTSEKTNDEKKNWSNMKDKEELKNILQSKISKKINTPSQLKNFRNYIIYLFYTDGIASRSELADSKILLKKPNQKLSDEYNYILIDVKNKSLEYIMNQYKTSKSYGQKIIKLNDSLFVPFYTYYKVLKNFNDNDWFLLNDTATGKLTRNRLGVIFSKLGDNIGKHLNITLNRHEKTSSVIDIDKVKKTASDMGHSPNEALNVYAKI